MGRKREVLNALEQLGIEYNELDSGEVLFNHDGGQYWFHPDGSKPEYVTVNKINEQDFAPRQKSTLFKVINEINKSAPGIKALMMGDDILLNCDLYSGRHRLCPSDLRGVLSRLDTTGKVMLKYFNNAVKK